MITDQPACISLSYISLKLIPNTLKCARRAKQLKLQWSGYLCRNSWKGIRFGKPCLQIRRPSRTPLHLSWSRTRGASILPARFSWLGMIHRTKFGLVFRSVTISLDSCSLYNCDTVLNMPLRVRAPNWVSVRACCAMPTISAANTKQNILVAYPSAVSGL
jgi:hypothetical protein